MNQLEKVNEVNLPAKSMEIYNVLQSPLIKDCSDEQIREVVINDMISAYFKAGFAYPSDSDFKIMADQMVINIRQQGFAMRLNEISIAFSRGVLKEYGEYMGLSIVSFTNFVKMYLMNNARLDALREYNTPKEEPKEPTEKEKFEMAKMNAIQAFLDVNAGKSIVLGSVVYDFLDTQGILNFTKEEKNQYMDRAKNLIISETNSRKEAESDSFKRNDLRRIIEAVTDGSEKSLVISKAKQLALIDFMRSLHLEGKNIADLIVWEDAD